MPPRLDLAVEFDNAVPFGLIAASPFEFVRNRRAEDRSAGRAECGLQFVVEQNGFAAHRVANASSIALVKRSLLCASMNRARLVPRNASNNPNR